jgi:hypothetical protein
VRSHENVRLETRRHGVVLVRPIARAVAVSAGGLALVIAGLPVALPLGVAGAVLLALGAMWAVRAVLRWDRTVVVVTADGLYVRYGVLRRRSASADGALEIEQGVLGRLLGYGTVIAGDLEVPYVPDPGRLTAA